MKAAIKSGTFPAHMVQAVNNAVTLGREANRYERMPRKRAFQTAEQMVSMVETGDKFVISWVGADRKKHRKTVSDRLQALVIAGSHKARAANLMLGGTEAEAQTAAASVNTANWTDFVEEVMNARHLFGTNA